MDPIEQQAAVRMIVALRDRTGATVTVYQRGGLWYGDAVLTRRPEPLRASVRGRETALSAVEALVAVTAPWPTVARRTYPPVTQAVNEGETFIAPVASALARAAMNLPATGPRHACPFCRAAQPVVRDGDGIRRCQVCAAPVFARGAAT